MEGETPSVDYAAVLADLKAKRADLDAAIAGIERMLGQAPAGSGSATANNSTQIMPDTFFGMSIADAARKYLSMMKATKTTPEIADALHMGGLLHASENWGNTVGSVLNRNPETFVRVRRGTWGLASWYPGRRRGVVAPEREESDAEPDVS